MYREIEADLETPVSAYLKVARGDYSFLLESVEGGERLARYSFIGTEPYKRVVTGPGQIDGDVDPLALVQEEIERSSVVSVPGLPRFHGGAVGYLSYEAMLHYEDVPSPEVDTLGLPEALFMFADTLLVFDHVKAQHQGRLSRPAGRWGYIGGLPAGHRQNRRVGGEASAAHRACPGRSSGWATDLIPNRIQPDPGGARGECKCRQGLHPGRGTSSRPSCRRGSPARLTCTRSTSTEP